MARKVAAVPAQREPVEVLPQVRCANDQAHPGHGWTSGGHLWSCPGRKVSKVERLLAVHAGHPDPDAS